MSIKDELINGNVSHAKRKLVYVICEQQRRRSACDSAQSDQHLYSSLLRRYNIYVCFIQNFKTLASFCCWAGRFESDLVANPEDELNVDFTISPVLLVSFCSQTVNEGNAFPFFFLPSIQYSICQLLNIYKTHGSNWQNDILHNEPAHDISNCFEAHFSGMKKYWQIYAECKFSTDSIFQKRLSHSKEIKIKMKFIPLGSLWNPYGLHMQDDKLETSCVRIKLVKGKVRGVYSSHSNLHGAWLLFYCPVMSLPICRTGDIHLPVITFIEVLHNGLWLPNDMHICLSSNFQAAARLHTAHKVALRSDRILLLCATTPMD